MSHNRLKIIVFSGWVLVASTGVVIAGFDALLNTVGISGKSTLNDTKIGQGLKEALKVGINKTAQLLGSTDGYYKNDLVRIGMPEKLKNMESLLRKVGMGQKLDDFVLSMNRAAEKAAPEARDVFVEAVGQMSIDDVQKIYKGNETAATDFFKAKSSTQLSARIKPIINKAMGSYGVTKKYQDLTAKYQALPFAKLTGTFDLDNYVTQKAMDGLFFTLGQQEKAIRVDPKARVTDLLKQVFGTK